MNLRGVNTANNVQQFNLVHLNVELPKINVYAYKPFIERLSKIVEGFEGLIDMYRFAYGVLDVRSRKG